MFFTLPESIPIEHFPICVEEHLAATFSGDLLASQEIVFPFIFTQVHVFLPEFSPPVGAVLHATLFASKLTLKQYGKPFNPHLLQFDQKPGTVPENVEPLPQNPLDCFQSVSELLYPVAFAPHLGSSTFLHSREQPESAFPLFFPRSHCSDQFLIPSQHPI